MKKDYTNPVIEIVEIQADDIVTASSYDPLGILSSDNYDDWFNHS